MKILNFCPAAIVTGQGSLAYLKELEGRRVLVVCGGSSMERAGVLDRVQSYLEEGGREVAFFRGIRQDPTRQQIDAGVALMRQFQPDTVVAVGGGSSMDAAKAMMLFYEFPELNLDVIGKVPFPKVRKLKLVAIPSTSGTASEVTRTSVVTDPDKQLKIPVIDQILKPDVAILDADLPMTMPDHIAAETGMDAMAHAIECYTRHDLDDFDEVLARGAVEGILKWLPVSVLEKTPEAREKMHHYQCMAGMAFTNVGVTAVHGISHALGAMYHIPHGLGNAILLPFVLAFNRQDTVAAQRLDAISHYCGVPDIVQALADLKSALGIPATLREQGLDEASFLRDLDTIAEKSLMGATKFNPVSMDMENMRQLLRTVYYGN